MALRLAGRDSQGWTGWARLWAGLLSGAVVVETVFNIPGLGRLIISAVLRRDYPVIQALTLVLAVLVSLAFLITDIVQMWLDPRVSR